MRRFILTAVACLLLLAFSPPAHAQNALHIPPTLEGTTFDLTMAPSTKEFEAGQTTNTFGFNGDYLGPTLLMNKGDVVQMNVTNNIDEVTTVHWHGFHIDAASDGGPHSTIAVGSTWTPSFTILNEAGTNWYHPHPHGSTAEHVNMGLAGMIIVRDDEEAALTLPRTYGVDDFPVIVQDRAFAPDGNFRFTPFGDEILINGTLDAFVEVPAQRVRLRVLNASLERAYMVGISDDRSFHLIANDVGLVDAPIEVNRVLMASGERLEMLVDFGSDQGSTSLSLMSYGSELPSDVPGAAGGPGGNNPLNGTDFTLLAFTVVAPTTDPVPVTTIPPALTTNEVWSEAQAARTRPFVFSGGGPGNPFVINGVEMDLNVINETAYLGDVEIWELENTTNIAHPFHKHDVEFFILDRNGNPPEAYETGPKDVVLVRANETVRFITAFKDFADPVVPYMYHCHILPHEDDGMMGQYVVLDPSVGVEEDPTQPTESPIAVYTYPNPARGAAHIAFPVTEAGPVRAEIYDVQGRRLDVLLDEYRAPGRYDLSWDRPDVASGVYLLRLQVPGYPPISRRFMIMR